MEFCDNGMVRVMGYPGYKFNPIKILKLEEGEELSKKLKELDTRYTNRRAEIDKEFRIELMKLSDLFNFLKKK